MIVGQDVESSEFLEQSFEDVYDNLLVPKPKKEKI